MNRFVANWRRIKKKFVYFWLFKKNRNRFKRKERKILPINKYSICIAFTYFIIFLYQNPHQSHIKGYVINKNKSAIRKKKIFSEIYVYMCICVCTYINIKSVNYRQSTYVFMIIFMHKITLPQLISSTSQNFYCSALYCWFETDISQFSQTEESKKKSTS